jgi:hypothetical protein
LEGFLRLFFAALLIIVCSAVPLIPQTGSGTMSGSFFNPFPIGAQWKMADALTGYTTNFSVLGLTAQTGYACYTPAYSSLIVDIHMTKTVQSTYPNPGVSQNEDLYVFKSAAWGPYIFEEMNSAITSPFAVSQTTYFFQQYANAPYGMMFQPSSTFWNLQQDSGKTNTCHTPPTSFPETWATVISQETRTTPVYAGAVNCSTYTSMTTTQNQEEWCFAADPLHRFQPMLVELDVYLVNGTTSDIKLRTTTITSFPRT